jgi:hypothetical protein
MSTDKEEIVPITPTEIVEETKPQDKHDDIRSIINHLIPVITNTVLKEVDDLEARGENIGLGSIGKILTKVFPGLQKDITKQMINETTKSLSDGRDTSNDK